MVDENVADVLNRAFDVAKQKGITTNYCTFAVRSGKLELNCPSGMNPKVIANELEVKYIIMDNAGDDLEDYSDRLEKYIKELPPVK